MVSVKGTIKPVIQNVHEAVIAPVKNEVVTGVGKAVETIISGPSKVSPPEQQEIAKRQQQAISRRWYLKRWIEQQATAQQRISLEAAQKEQQQKVEDDKRKKANVQQFEVTGNPLTPQPKRKPGLPFGGVKQKQTAFERTKKAA